MAKRIEYITGKFNNMTTHSWTCLDCMKHITKVGGRSAKSAGRKEAYNHTCVDTSNDSWNERKDLQ
mgnify:CR=1 FL=1